MLVVSYLSLFYWLCTIFRRNSGILLLRYFLAFVFPARGFLGTVPTANPAIGREYCWGTHNSGLVRFCYLAPDNSTLFIDYSVKSLSMS